MLHSVGDDGYLELARQTLSATRRLIEGAGRINGLRVLGDPEMALVAMAADDPELDVFAVCDEMAARGWYVQAQLGYHGIPASIHLTVTASADAIVDAMLADLQTSVEAARTVGGGADPEMLAAVAALDPDDLPDDVLGTLLPLAGLEPGGGLPERMAGINALMEAMPARLRERLLVEFLGMLFTPEREA